MIKKQKRTLVIAGIIGTLFACYEEDERYGTYSNGTEECVMENIV